MSDTLFLPLKKEWYELIEKGIKKEEYREVKTYWAKRLFAPTLQQDAVRGSFFKKFDAVTFVYGYTKRKMIFECNGLEMNTGIPEWGAKPGVIYFVIKLGRRLK